MARADERKYAAQNRRARFDFFINETIEAGIMLTGTEVKSLRAGRVSIAESYAGERDGELYLINAHFPEYQLAGRFFQHEPRRPRKLLVRRREMDKLFAAVRRDGVTLIPLSIYFSDRGYAKVEIGVAKGKKKGDKRETEKERDWQRDKARLMRAKG
ncbi:SsrA-binding protein SmpB [Nitrospirillum iridis]|uniref:SsrA-binding protein n=1 Tax=Nitrospirillum iridis TaxID=765888 RepID=A0A7X0AUC4_9PROT|nr:SsrA-binding protein SmpB [Nitrospirillum iridis]MBB6250203.1 SsrA-binding protein [Nitrospirillum iridis]